MRAIPARVDDLTPAWFAAVLGAPVAGVEVLAADSGTTGRARVRLLGGASSLPDSVFCKLAPFDERQREFLRRVGIGVMEARLYAELGGELPVRVPGVLHAEFDGDAFVMVLEDLLPAGCTFPRPSDPDVGERAAKTVEALGHLHARFWESPRFGGDLSWVPERAGFGEGGGKSPEAASAAGYFIRKALDRFAGEMPPAFGAVGSLYVEHTAEILDLWDEGERTLIHGDPHSGNLFTDRGQTGFFDWAMVSRSPGVRDVAYYCCNSLPADVRRGAEADLLALYRRTLADGGVDLGPSLAEHQYRLFSVFSWVSAVSTAAVGSRWQPSERAMAAMDRTTTAIEDLDAAGLLTDLLA